MIGSHDDGLDTSNTALPPAAGGSINGMRVLMGLLLLLIAVAAISGVVVALTSGQPTVAFIIGLVSVAFFSRVGC
ncbi:hypothetical protein [Mycolicibacterium grossiae]|uniref:Uncharacterized protein n=1 Tax=Mycolicibacterium grossiae TaxID=1552759 RepID=A0A1E8QAP3_9MYCO|nr:hypothetical protein [Mycolicibacterium grossiae]OFJ55084.1 hypothetical protein BEL07_03780 [Mycolicibacterium grossiae]QEM47859.1 hypothetical protein FZ046_26625 [Mycolicibacterium grossiae]